MRKLLLAVAVVSVAGCSLDSVPLTAVSDTPALAAVSGISGQYIVVFRDDTKNAAQLARELGAAHGGSIRHVYTGALKGMALSLSGAAADEIRRNPNVALVEQDRAVVLGTESNATPLFSLVSSGSQAGAPWHLDRIDQRALSLNGVYNFPSDGSGATIYFLDGGSPRFTHNDLGGRLTLGLNLHNPGSNGSECLLSSAMFHVGAAMSATYGSAKGVNGVSVILGCNGSGTLSTIIAGVDWVTQNRTNPAVGQIHFFLNSVSVAFNTAIQNSIASGVTWITSATGTGVDACTISPQSAPDILTVAGTHENDAWVSGSGFGKCVHMAAPARVVTSLDVTNDDAIVTGLSGAAPALAAGVAAQYLTAYPNATPGTVRAALLQGATAGAISGVPASTPNLLLYNGGGAALPQPATAAAFNYRCTGLSCTFYGSSSVNAVTSNWNFGDGQTGSGVAVTHSFPKPGGKAATYVVSLVVTDASAGTATVSRTIKCAKTNCS